MSVLFLFHDNKMSFPALEGHAKIADSLNHFISNQNTVNYMRKNKQRQLSDQYIGIHSLWKKKFLMVMSNGSSR